VASAFFGYEAEDWLIREKKLSLGLSDERRLLIIFTIGNDAKDTDELLSALKAMAKWARDGGSDKKGLRRKFPNCICSAPSRYSHLRRLSRRVPSV
jgi:hypothetical protein